MGEDLRGRLGGRLTWAGDLGPFVDAKLLHEFDGDSRFTFEIQGSKGSREFTFASGTTLAEVSTGINTFKSVTGVSA